MALDKARVTGKIDELNNYLEELESIKPLNFDEYKASTEKRRACERLLQISVETVIGIGNLLVSGLKLGVPSDEDDLFKKLKSKKLISEKIEKVLNGMKGFRNILVHKYGDVNDELVFENLSNLSDFTSFIEEIEDFIKKNK